MDEPTNHLDMETRDALELALNEFEGAIIVVSHDKQLLNSCVDQFWWVHEKQVELYFGSLDTYLQEQMKRLKLAATNSDRPVENSEVNKKAIRQANANLRKQLDQQLKPLKQKVSKLEKSLSQAQERLTEIHAQMEDSSLYEAQNKSKLEPLLIEEAKLNTQIEQLEENWLELEEQMETVRDDFEKGL